MLGLLLKEIFRLQRRFQISAIESIDFFGRTGSDRRGFHRHFSSGIREFSASALPEAHVSRRRPARARRPLAVGDDARRLLGGRDGGVVRAGTSESLSRAMRARGGVRRRLRPERRRVGRVAFRRHLRRGEPAPLGDRRGRRRPAQLADVLDVRPRRGHRPGRAGRVDDRAPGRRHLRPRGGPYLSGNRRSPGESRQRLRRRRRHPRRRRPRRLRLLWRRARPTTHTRSRLLRHPRRRVVRAAPRPSPPRGGRRGPSRKPPRRLLVRVPRASSLPVLLRPTPLRATAHPRDGILERPVHDIDARAPLPALLPDVSTSDGDVDARAPLPALASRPRARRPSHRHTPRRRDSRSSSPSSSP